MWKRSTADAYFQLLMYESSTALSSFSKRCFLFVYISWLSYFLPILQRYSSLSSDLHCFFKKNGLLLDRQSNTERETEIVHLLIHPPKWPQKPKSGAGQRQKSGTPSWPFTWLAGPQVNSHDESRCISSKLEREAEQPGQE